jgi:hypothetical protein
MDNYIHSKYHEVKETEFKLNIFIHFSINSEMKKRQNVIYKKKNKQFLLAFKRNKK